MHFRKIQDSLLPSLLPARSSVRVYTALRACSSSLTSRTLPRAVPPCCSPHAPAPCLCLCCAWDSILGVTVAWLVRGEEYHASQPRRAGQGGRRERKGGAGILTAVCISQSGRLTSCSISVAVGDTVHLPSPHGHSHLRPTRSPQPVPPRRGNVSRLEATISRFPLRTWGGLPIRPRTSHSPLVNA